MKRVKSKKVQIKILATKDERKQLKNSAAKEDRSLSKFMVLAGLERGGRKAIEARDGEVLA